MAGFIALAGDRDVSEYSREDAKLYVRHLEMKGNKTATIRRRINSLSAILNYAYTELDLDKRNPFSRLIIKAEGGPVAELCRSFNRILCTKGEYTWETNQQQNLDRKLCA